jgi:hypothetical protein
MGRMTYAVRWRENDGPAVAGGLSLGGAGLELTGAAARRALMFDDVSELYLERGGQPALVLVTRDGDRVAIASLQGLGALHEVADRVAAGRGRVAV